MYNICESDRNENDNNRYYQNIQKQRYKSEYYYENNNNEIYTKKNNMKNFRKLDKKHKCNSLDKINIENYKIFSFKDDITNYNKNYNNNYNNNGSFEEDLDIELESVSTKIPIKQFYLSNKEKNKNNDFDYFDENKIYIKNLKDIKRRSPAERKKRSKIKRHASYDNLYKNEKNNELIINNINTNNVWKKAKNIDIIDNNMKKDFKDRDKDINIIKTEFDFYKKQTTGNKGKITIESKINNMKIYTNDINRKDYDLDDDYTLTNLNYDNNNEKKNRNLNMIFNENNNNLNRNTNNNCNSILNEITTIYDNNDLEYEIYEKKLRNNKGNNIKKQE